MDVVQPDRKKSTFLLEIERRSNDLLRVYNPTDKDYIIEWDRRGGTKMFRVPAKQEAVHIRYIAEKYIREMYQIILNDKARKAILEENATRVSKGLAEMDKTMRTGEQLRFESKFYKPTNEESRKIISLLYLGIETEYGVDRQYAVEQKEKESRDFGDVLKSVQEEKDSGIVPLQREQTASVPLQEPVQTTGVLSCEYPGCTFTTQTKIALLGHKRSHRSDAEQTINQA